MEPLGPALRPRCNLHAIYMVRGTLSYSALHASLYGTVTTSFSVLLKAACRCSSGSMTLWVCTATLSVSMCLVANPNAPDDASP